MPKTFLQFELKPNIRRPVFDHQFTTNGIGLRDRPGYQRPKPPGTFRIALLGSSIDMGWGVPVEQTYENRLENWLNARAEMIGLDRRFEVLNFAMAAYGPAQRLECYRKKVQAFQPDLVLYAVTMLDPRLSQIHLVDVLRYRAPVPYGFVHQVIQHAGLEEPDLTLTAEGALRHKEWIKNQLKPHLWELADGALGTLAAECRARQTPVACLIVPRAGLSDLPQARAVAVAHHQAIANHHAVPCFDLTGAFDDDDPNALALAPWDDHPNADGHQLLFYDLAEHLVRNQHFSNMLFNAPRAGQNVLATAASDEPAINKNTQIRK